MPESLTEIGKRLDNSKWSGHSYLPLYDKLFVYWRYSEITLVEVGIYDGNSMHLWLQYFTKARIVGIDSGPFPEFHERIRTIQMNQQDPQMASLFAPESVDIIVDDAGHVPHEQIACWHSLWPALKPGGLYLIEDINLDLHGGTKVALEPLVRLHPGANVVGNFKDGYGNFRDDDVLLWWRK